MNEPHHYDLKKLEEYLPHRFENMLLDGLDVYPDHSSDFELTISEGDASGRDIFAESISPTLRCIPGPIGIEILALASCVSSGKPLPTQVVLLTGIQNFVQHAPLPFGTPMVGKVHLIGFKRFISKKAGALYDVAGNLLLETELTAALVDIDVLKNIPKQNQACIIDPNTFSCQSVSHLSWNKNPAFVLIDKVCPGPEFIGIGTFLDSHLTAKGHFPGKPILMGVLQLTAIEDTFFAFAFMGPKPYSPGHHRLYGNAVIKNQYGEIVCDCKGLVVQLTLGVPGLSDQAEVVQIARLGFRQSVKPGDTFFVSISLVDDEAHD